MQRQAARRVGALVHVAPGHAACVRQGAPRDWSRLERQRPGPRELREGRRVGRAAAAAAAAAAGSGRRRAGRRRDGRRVWADQPGREHHALLAPCRRERDDAQEPHAAQGRAGRRREARGARRGAGGGAKEEARVQGARGEQVDGRTSHNSRRKTMSRSRSSSTRPSSATRSTCSTVTSA